MSLDATTLHYSFLFNGSHVVIRAGLFFGHLKKNSRCKKLKTQEKNSKLKLKNQIFGTFEKNKYLCTEMFDFYLVSQFGKPIIIKKI